jgi:hypothetical protein
MDVDVYINLSCVCDGLRPVSIHNKFHDHVAAELQASSILRAERLSFLSG